MKTLAIDIETYSSKDLTKVGVYPYSESEDFTILLFAYCYDDEAVKIIDLATEYDTLPNEIIKDLQDPKIIKTAFNANFERVCLKSFLNGMDLPVEQWRCTMIKCASLGLPLSLSEAAKALRVEIEKMQEGKKLINLFSKPNKQGIRTMPNDNKDAWEVFKSYCIRDVEVERAIARRLKYTNLLESEVKLYALDQKINDFGVKIDSNMVLKAIELSNAFAKKKGEELVNLTNVENYRSVKQIREIIAEKGVHLESLSKNYILENLHNIDNEEVKQILSLRLDLAKTSVKKYEAMKKCMCKDGRLRGLFQFYGTRTGRWAGKNVQVQNLPRNVIELDAPRDILSSASSTLADFEKVSTDVNTTLSQLIRTSFVGDFLVADFSAIEARVLSWLSGETWRMEVFATDGKIYEASASRMFNVPIDKVTDDLRQRGKVAELALGYGGGSKALKKMDRAGKISESEYANIVHSWRSKNICIVKLWKELETAFKMSINDFNGYVGCLKFIKDGTSVIVVLPSGRFLYYRNARILTDNHIAFMSVNQMTKKWSEDYTYGGKLAENITQAIARDILAHAMLEIDKRGYKIVMHIHDEVIVEASEGLEDVLNIMKKAPQWAHGLVLDAKGYVTKYYKKD